MPMRNLLSILAAVAVGVWGYFGLVERLTLLEMQNASLTKDLEHAEQKLTADIEKNNEFRIKYPRGELGQSSQDIEQFMLIEDLYTTVDRMQKHLDSMSNNKINIEFLNKQMECHWIYSNYKVLKRSRVYMLIWEQITEFPHRMLF